MTTPAIIDFDTIYDWAVKEKKLTRKQWVAFAQECVDRIPAVLARARAYDAGWDEAFAEERNWRAIRLLTIANGGTAS